MFGYYRIVADTCVYEIHAAAAADLKPLGFRSLGWGGAIASAPTLEVAAAMATAAREVDYETVYVTRIGPFQRLREQVAEAVSRFAARP